MKKLFRQPTQIIGISILLLMFLFVSLGPLFVTHDPAAIDFSIRLSPPTKAHWLGTDQFGRDVLARILEGGRRSLGAALLVISGVLVISVFLGLSAAMSGGIVDHVISRTVDIILALPSLVFALAIVGLLGPGFGNLVLAMVVSHWASSTRLVRSFVLTARSRPDVIAAWEAGLSWPQIILGHILPEVFSKLVIVLSLRLGDIIVSISGLSFLGLGVQPPAAEWGAMLSQARLFFEYAPWLLLAPATAIFLTVIAANMVGESIQSLIDPNLNKLQS